MFGERCTHVGALLTMLVNNAYTVVLPCCKLPGLACPEFLDADEGVVGLFMKLVIEGEIMAMQLYLKRERVL